MDGAVIWQTVVDVLRCTAITAVVVSVLVVARIAALGRDA